MPRLVQYGIFIAALALVLFVANLVVYEAVATAFGISSTLVLRLLGLALGILSLSFIASSVLGSHYYNVFSRGYYLLSSIWLGSFLYFFTASIIYGAVAQVPGLHAQSLGELLIGLALLVSAYGVVHARVLRIARVEVSLPKLPSAWAGKKALFMSDLHLGQIHGPSFARRVAAAADGLSPDIILIGGDLFDGTGAPDADDLVAPLKALRARWGVYYITGNHEDYGDKPTFLAAVRGAGMRILMDEAVDIEGLQLAGVDYKNAADEHRFESILASFDINPSRPSILLKHEPNHLLSAEAAGVSLTLCGHTHAAQQWPLGYIARMIYKKFYYGLQRLHTMQVYTSSGAGTWGPPVRVGTNSELVLITLAAQKA